MQWCPVCLEYEGCGKLDLAGIFLKFSGFRGSESYSYALNLVEISFFFSKFLNILISLAAVAYLTNFLTLSYSSVSFHYPLGIFKYPCSWIYRWKSVWITAILVIKTWHFNLEVPVNVDWGKKLL